MYLLLSLYVLMVFKFPIDRIMLKLVNVDILSVIFPPIWVSCDRWIRSQYPFKLCTPRTAIYSMRIALIFDCLWHVHFWPTVTILSVTIIPAISMMIFVLAIAINVKNSRNRVLAIQQTDINQHERRHARFLHRQMLILMFATLILVFYYHISCGCIPFCNVEIRYSTIIFFQSFFFLLKIKYLLENDH